MALVAAALLLLTRASIVGMGGRLTSDDLTSPTTVGCSNRSDCTLALQTVLSSGAETIRIPALQNPTGPWFVAPLMLPSHATVIFEPGCVVEALPGIAGQRAYKSGNAVLFTAQGAQNLTIIGHGATWRMQRRSYANATIFSRAEWRHTLRLSAVDNVKIIGLTLEESGGDGIYINAGASNIHIEKVRLLRHYRQAMSLVDVTNLTVVDTELSSTGQDGFGTAPMAGVDLEPNAANASLCGIVFSRCNFTENFGAGVQFSLGKLGQSAPPLDVRIEYCRVDGNASALVAELGTRVNTVCASGPKHLGRGHSCTNVTCPDQACYSSASPGFEISANPGQRGQIVVVDTIVTDTLDHGLWIRDFAPGPLTLIFRRSSFFATASRPGPLLFPNFTAARGTHILVTPVGVSPMGKYAWRAGGEAIGSVHFENVSIADSLPRPWLLAERVSSIGLTGNARVANPHGCHVSGPGTGNMSGLDVACVSLN